MCKQEYCRIGNCTAEKADLSRHNMLLSINYTDDSSTVSMFSISWFYGNIYGTRWEDREYRNNIRDPNNR